MESLPILVLLALLVLSIALLVAPLLIWRHTRRSAEALEALRHLAAEAYKRDAAHQHSMLEEARLMREVLKEATAP